MSIPLKKDQLPKEVVEGLYNPSYLPRELNLNEFIEDPDQIKRETQESLHKVIQVEAEPTEGAPLTEAQAEEVDRYIESLKESIAQTRGRIATLRAHIDATAIPENGPEFTLQIDISKKPSVRKAIQKVFGYKTNSLTYSMYKAAIELKRKIEQDEANSYVNGENT